MTPPLQNFLSVALPIMITFITVIWVAAWAQNKRFDDTNRRMSDGFASIQKRLDDIVARATAIEARLVGIETRLAEHGEKIARLEERSSPFARR